MTTGCAYECQLLHFGFSDCSANAFYVSQWGNNKPVFIVYRAIFFVYSLAWIIADRVVVGEFRYEIYLTNWTEVTGCIYFGLALCVTIYGCTSHSKKSSELRWFHKITWIVFNVTFSAAVVTDLLFWALLSSAFSSALLADPFNIHSHAINFLMIVIDLLVSSFPIRLLHLVYPASYGLVYMLATLIVHWSGVTSRVYSVLDWSNSPGVAAGYSLGTALVAMPVAHLLCVGLYQLRACIARSTGHAGQQLSEGTTENMEMGQVNRGFE